MHFSDVLIIGSGAAGLSLALGLADACRVTVVTKKGPADSNTNWAQGGIATVVGDNDSFDLHVADTLRTGAGLCRRDVVEFVVSQGPKRIANLVSLGVPFSHAGDDLALGLEGGHSRKRIVHAQDRTGRAVEKTLLQRVREHDHIDLLDHHMAVNLITEKDVDGVAAAGVYGAYVLDLVTSEVEVFAARKTVVASGGAGKVYLYTSNPDIATGDGVAMAYRAGARIANLEFVQFHPTCLYHPEIRSFLLSEALRGEGGVLLRRDGTAFMTDYHEMADLAPRDIVARAADNEMKQSGEPCVYLDLTARDRSFLQERFPSIYQKLERAGIDMASEPIPVVPATHYFCGGIDVDGCGRASIPHLYAIGEVSHTGLHGANRLASNSLLEALAFAVSTRDGILADMDLDTKVPRPRAWEDSTTETISDLVILEHDWDAARRVMWDYVGIVRSDARLKIAQTRMEQLRQTVHELYWNCKLTSDLLELRNIILVGQLVIASARQRKESRGLHYNESYPYQDDKNFAHDTVLEIAGES